jgi:hypothetical protein
MRGYIMQGFAAALELHAFIENCHEVSSLQHQSDSSLRLSAQAFRAATAQELQGSIDHRTSVDASADLSL